MKSRSLSLGREMLFLKIAVSSRSWDNLGRSWS